MKRTFCHPETQSTAVLLAGDDDFTLDVDGRVECVDTWSAAGVPPSVYLAERAAALVGAGYAEVWPDDLLAQMEAQHGHALTGRLRAFYADGAWKRYEGKRCGALDCTVSFISQYSLGDFGHEFWDAQAREMIALWPLSSITNARGYEDEQQWIGADPRRPDGPVYHLFTSNAYEVLYPSLDAFLADLTDLGSPSE